MTFCLITLKRPSIISSKIDPIKYHKETNVPLLLLACWLGGLPQLEVPVLRELSPPPLNLRGTEYLVPATGASFGLVTFGACSSLLVLVDCLRLSTSSSSLSLVTVATNRSTRSVSVAAVLLSSVRLLLLLQKRTRIVNGLVSSLLQ